MTRQWIPLSGLLTTIAASAYMVVQLSAQGAAVDLTNASLVTVRDAQGQVVLQGQFTAKEGDGRPERKAALTAAGASTTASGEAEIEFGQNGPEEIEFSVENLPPGATFTFVVDGADVASATTDKRGRAEVELDVPRPATAAR
jgi:hypothetical protein